MPDKRLLQDVATVFAPIGENNSGVQQYSVYLFSEVFCRAAGGVKRNKEGSTSQDEISLYIFDSASKALCNGTETNVCDACESIFYVQRSASTSIDTGQACYIVPYNAANVTTPPAGSRRITRTVRRKAGGNRMWHWEVHAE